jgi:DDE superfamily endonuclease
MPCAAPILTLLEPFRCLFTAPTWTTLLTLLGGTLLARGRRTVTAALWHTGQHQDPHFSAFHQVLNRAPWSPLATRGEPEFTHPHLATRHSPLAASRSLLTLIVDTFLPAGGPLDVVIDATLERRWGATIRQRGP